MRPNNHVNGNREEKLYVNVVGKCSIVVATLLASLLLPRLGPFKSWLLGATMGVPGQLLGILPWCGNQCQAGPYVSTFIGALAGALAGPAASMYIAASIAETDLAKAQSAREIIGQIIGNFSPVFFTAVFYGDREQMTRGYLLSAALSCVVIVATGLALPRFASLLERTYVPQSSTATIDSGKGAEDGEGVQGGQRSNKVPIGAAFCDMLLFPGGGRRLELAEDGSECERRITHIPI